MIFPWQPPSTTYSPLGNDHPISAAVTVLLVSPTPVFGAAAPPSPVFAAAVATPPVPSHHHHNTTARNPDVSHHSPLSPYSHLCSRAQPTRCHRSAVPLLAAAVTAPAVHPFCRRQRCRCCGFMGACLLLVSPLYFH
ncbi:hypothetical protein SESBI_35426 [Sesbania bispinosa]|nr:hypothetical protein SESBI_35426 [Sesbania bispinosa]